MNVGVLYLINSVKGTFVRKYQYFYRFELKNVSTYHSLSALDVSQSVHAKIYIGMHRGSDFKFPDYL